jgi:hypothetical protein
MKNGLSLKKIISLRKLVNDLRPIDILIGEIVVEVTGVDTIPPFGRSRVLSYITTKH